MIAEPNLDIRFECTQCGQRFVVDASAAGMNSSCTVCDTKFVVPGPASRRSSSVPSQDHSHRTTSKQKRPVNGAAFTPERKRIPAADPDLSALREELVGVSMRSRELERALSTATEEIAGLKQQLKAAIEERERLNTSVTHTQVELKSFQTERQQSRTDVANLRQRVVIAESQLAAREQDLAAFRESAEALQAQIANAEAALAAERQQRENAEALWREVNRALEASEAQLQASDATLDQYAANEESLNQELAGLRSRLAAAAEWQTRLVHAEAQSQTARESLEGALAENRTLAARCEELRGEAVNLQRDLTATDSGRELVQNRAKLEAVETEQKQIAAKLAAAEAELKTLQNAEATLQADLAAAQRGREKAQTELEAAKEARVVKDNEVLRGIINRQNAELAQHHRDLFRLRKARFALKIVYAIFGIGLLGVAAFALKILLPALSF